ncbi:MAG: hypothetical protein QM487_15460 [Candidatus Marithrix sp.]
MALTESEKQCVINALNKMARSTLQRVLDSIESFENWLYNKLYSIYTKVKNSISSMWNWLCGIF